MTAEQDGSELINKGGAAAVPQHLLPEVVTSLCLMVEPALFIPLVGFSASGTKLTWLVFKARHLDLSPVSVGRMVGCESSPCLCSQSPLPLWSCSEKQLQLASEDVNWCSKAASGTQGGGELWVLRSLFPQLASQLAHLTLLH